jgi:serine/threonine-protein kinase
MAEDNANSTEGSLSNSIRQIPPVKVAMPRPGDLFAGRYEVERILGRGGMGEVYAAVQRPLGRRVAVKILKTPDSIEDDPNFQSRFMREAAAAARLTHPNTITVFDFGQTDEGVLFIVMEYLEGSDVRTVLRHEGQLSPVRAIHIAKQVCKSLREAHRKGIVHRDLKPANILLLTRDDDPDFAKVLDFGLVKLRGEASEITLAGKFLGSPRYTSPESLDRNKEVDHRADIYAMGILIYAMITGHPPFDGDAMQVLNAHLHEIPQPMYKASPSAKTTPELEDVVARCLQKDPDRRFQSMSELLTALRAVGAFYGDHETETIELENTGEESIELDDSITPGSDLAAPGRPSPAGDAILDSTGKMRAVRVRRKGAPGEISQAPPAAPTPPDSPPQAKPTERKKPPPPRVEESQSRTGLWVALSLLLVAGGTFAALQSRRADSDATPATDPSEAGETPALRGATPAEPDATPELVAPTPAPVAKPRTTPRSVKPRPTPAAAVTPKPTPRAQPTPTPEEPKRADETAPGYKPNPYE